MSFFPTNANQVQAFAGAMYGIQIGSITMAQVTSDIAAAGGLKNALNGYYTASFGTLPTASVAATVASNLGLTGAALTSGVAYITAQLNGVAAGARGALISDIVNLFSGLSSDATFGAAATAWNTKVAAAVIYTGATNVAVGTVVAAAASVFTLTTASNTFVGTASNDSFEAGLSAASLNTLNSGDRLDGGDGTDELFAVVSSSVTPASIVSIENVIITATAVSTVDMTNSTGIVNATNQASTAGLTLSGLTKATNVTVRDTAAAGQVVQYRDVTGSADAATINLANVSGTVTLQVAGVETLTLNSAGSVANTLAGLVTANTTTLNVTGTQGINLGTLGATVATLDASAHTPADNIGVTVTTASTAASVITGGAGNDTIVIRSAAVNDNVSTGNGNDNIRFVDNFTTADTVNGGDGTDTLSVLAGNIAGATTPTTYTVTNIETIAVTDALAAATYTPANTSATAVTFNVVGNTNAAGAAITTGAALSVATGTVVGPAGAFTIGLGTSLATNTAGLLAAGGALTINDTGAGTTDAVTINNNARQTGAANLDVYNGTNFVVGGYETVTFNTGSVAGGATNTFGTIAVTGDLGGTAAETVNFTGANIVSAGIITADIVNASGLTAAGLTTAPTILMVTGSTATTVTGSAGIDVLFGHSTTGSLVDGGAGNDTLNGGSGADTLLGGAGQDTLLGGAGNDSLNGGDGNDSINAGAGNDNIDGGAGNDTVNMEANLNSGDTVVGGDGTDTLILTGGATPTAADAQGVSGFETLTLAGTATTAVTLSNFINNAFTRVNADLQGGVTVAIDGAGTALATLGLTNVNDNANTISMTRLVDLPTNSLAVAIGLATSNDGVSITNLNINDEETITIASSGLSTAGFTVNTITGTLQARDSTSITITGAKALTIGAIDANNATTSTGTLTSLDMSAATGAVSIGAVTNTANMTILGASSVASTVSGGQGNDSITGGIGADSLLGGDGADTLVGDDGNDILTGGAGADVINGGAGTDTYSAVGTNAASIDGTAGTSTGQVINLGATAITSSSASTTMGGGFGISSLLGSVAANTAVYVYGNLTTAGSTAVDTLVSIENVVGSSGTDLIVGSAAANNLSGGDGADTINGGAGADTIDGGAAADSLTGGEGADVITGGAGDDAIVLTETTSAADVVVFSGATLVLNGADTITGFVQAVDGLRFSSLTAGSLQVAINAGTMATAGDLQAQGTPINLATNKLFVAQVADFALIDTAAEVIVALADTGVMDALDVAANATAFLVVSGANQGTTAFVYGIVNDGTAAIVTGELVLLGTITTDTNVFTAANFSF